MLGNVFIKRLQTFFYHRHVFTSFNVVLFLFERFLHPCISVMQIYRSVLARRRGRHSVAADPSMYPAKCDADMSPRWPLTDTLPDRYPTKCVVDMSPRWPLTDRYPAKCDADMSPRWPLTDRYVTPHEKHDKRF